MLTYTVWLELGNGRGWYGAEFSDRISSFGVSSNWNKVRETEGRGGCTVHSGFNFFFSFFLFELGLDGCMDPGQFVRRTMY